MTTIDPSYLAEQLRVIRGFRNLTQANVADVCGLTTRTIEKLESGKHRPDQQTLRSLARGLGVDVSAFQKPSGEQLAQARRDLERAIRTSATVRLSPVRTAQQALAHLDAFDGWMTDITLVEGDEALEAAAGLAERVAEDGELWEELPIGGHLEIAKAVAADCCKLEHLGHVCLFGKFRQVMRVESKKLLVFNIGVLAVRRKEEGMSEQIGIVPLKDGWETHPDDRVQIPTIAEKQDRQTDRA